MNIQNGQGPQLSQAVWMSLRSELHSGIKQTNKISEVYSVVGQRCGSFQWNRIHRGIFACVPLTSRIVIGESA